MRALSVLFGLLLPPLRPIKRHVNCCNFVWKTSIKLYYIVISSSIRCRLFNAQYVVFVFPFLGFTTYNRNITHFLVYLLFNRIVPFRWDNSSLFKDYKLNYSIFAVQWMKLFAFVTRVWSLLEHFMEGDVLFNEQLYLFHRSDSSNCSNYAPAMYSWIFARQRQ